MVDPLSPLLTAREVAQLLHVKISTIYAAAASGRLPAVCLWKGRRRRILRFRSNDLEQFIRERSIPANEDSRTK